MIKNFDKTKAILVLLFCCYLSNTTCRGQDVTEEGSPAWIVDMYFVEKNFPNKSAYLAGGMASEAQSPSFGASVSDEVRVTYRELSQDENTAVFAINISDTSHNQDLYCYLNHDEQWKIVAIRGLYVWPPMLMFIDLMKADPAPDDSTRRLLGRLQLFVSSDSELIAHIADNLTLFNTLIDDYRNDRQSDVEAKLTSLKLSSIYERDDFPDCVFVLIDGLVDDEAGYIYAENEESVPMMSPGRFIYVEKVAPHWYLYKTT